MKKSSGGDLRGKTREMIEKLNLSDAKIALQMEINPATVYRWRTGKSNPHPGQFERLKALAGGGESILRETGPTYAGGETAGRLEQLTRQIQMLQESIGSLKDRVHFIESKIGPGQSDAKKKPEATKRG